MMHKRFRLAAAACILMLSAAGCSAANAGFQPEGEIDVLTREEGSGTRSAFAELTGLEEKDANGNKVDTTSPEISVTNSTAVMLTSTSQDPQAIGYVSMGSLNDTVKTVAIDGASPTPEAVKDGTYPIARPFLAAVKESELSDSAKDFLAFVLSRQGQDIAQSLGYVPLGDAKEYTPGQAGEKVVIHGSSSVAPLMEKLQEAYLEVQPNAEIELQASDSSTGLKDAAAGIADIGMSSRDLSDSELSQGLTPIIIAQDGIAVIVNPENPIENLDQDQIKEIYQKEVTTWSSLQ